MKMSSLNRCACGLIGGWLSLLALLALPSHSLGQAVQSKPKKETKTATADSLEEMLAIALQHNPDIQAAKAKLQAAEAELDRTRLGVVRNVTAYRATLLGHKIEISSIEADIQLQAAEFKRMAQLAESRAISQKELRTAEFQLRTARNKLALARAKLIEIQAEMPFLLGRRSERHAHQDDTGKERARKMLEIARTGFELKVKMMQAGEASDLSAMYDWSRRWMEAERAVSQSRSDQVATIASHLDRMKHFQELVLASYKQAEVGQDQVIAYQFYVAEAELWLSQAKDP